MIQISLVNQILGPHATLIAMILGIDGCGQLALLA
jgi:hypothetical protein